MYGGITAFTELLLDAAAVAAQVTGVGIAIIIAANRTRHPMDARTLARLAAQFAGQGVVGFGLSNDERRGPAEEFERAFGIAGRAGLLLVPHAGELLGAASVTAALDRLHADRIGHGVRAVEDPEVVKRLAAAGVTLEVCPSSNVALGVAPDAASVPVRTLFEAGVPVALGADDPLLFGRRLVKQYEIARDVHGFTPPRAGRPRPHVGPRLRRPRLGPHPPARRHRRLAELLSLAQPRPRAPTPGPEGGRCDIVHTLTWSMRTSSTLGWGALRGRCDIDHVWDG